MTPHLCIDVLSAEAGAGLRAQFVVTGLSGSATYQRLLRTQGLAVIGEPAVAAFAASDVLKEILRCVPRVGDPEDLDEVSLPWESAMLLADPQSRVAAEVHNLSAWPETPEAVASLLGPMRAWCDVVTSCTGYARVRHWVCGDRGWLELGLTDGMIRLVPLRREDMCRRLGEDLAAAMVRSLRSAA